MGEQVLTYGLTKLTNGFYFKIKVKVALLSILVVSLGIHPLLAEGKANQPQGGRAPAGQIRRPAQKVVNTYYIWSYDGKLLAEYDQDNNCTREYIYAGNRLVAEYRPMTDKYYYHMQDQVNSTRFLSPDPIINKQEALANPQLWNLYSFCGNNPINYLDPDGREQGTFQSDLMERFYWEGKYGKAFADRIIAFRDKTRAMLTAAVILTLTVGEVLLPGKTIDDLIRSSKPGRETKGRSKIREKDGGFDQAKKDFKALNPHDVKDYPDGKKIGKLDDESTVIIRKRSKHDRRPTLEIQRGKNNKNKIKIRYDDK